MLTESTELSKKDDPASLHSSKQSSKRTSKLGSSKLASKLDSASDFSASDLENLNYGWVQGPSGIYSRALPTYKYATLTED